MVETSLKLTQRVVTYYMFGVFKTLATVFAYLAKYYIHTYPQKVSVTGWLDYLFSIWPFTTMKSWPITSYNRQSRFKILPKS